MRTNENINDALDDAMPLYVQDPYNRVQRNVSIANGQRNTTIPIKKMVQLSVSALSPEEGLIL